VYRSEVESITPDCTPGSIVTVVDSRGVPLGSAGFSAASQITLRLVSTKPALTREGYVELVRNRTHQALDLRGTLAPVTPQNNAHRLIFSEADELPGIVADRYNDLILLQLLTQSTAQPDIRQAIAEVLRDRLQPATILERPDPRIRVAEALEITSGEPLHGSGEHPKLNTTFTINGLHFAYDAMSGQKTGAFLDQRLNYAAAAGHAHGTALDLCTYQGGFALHLAQTCARVTGVDTSRSALEVADSNLELNPHLPGKVDWIEADAFDLLREYDAAGHKYDTVVLDPPAFAKSQRALEGAMRGYKELNLRALKMLTPGGTLVTCSCSHHVPLTEFTQVLAAAAADSNRRVQLLETRGAAPDHPAILTLPETTYLKCLIARVT
jgi:23S rRNA (cytosine1962-C5)-methyltransferase